MGLSVVALALGMMSCSAPDVNDPAFYCWEVKVDNDVVAYEWATGALMQTELDAFNNIVGSKNGYKAKAYKTNHKSSTDCTAADKTIVDSVLKELGDFFD